MFPKIPPMQRRASVTACTWISVGLLIVPMGKLVEFVIIDPSNV